MLRLVLLTSAFIFGAFSHVIIQQPQLAHPAVVNSQIWEHQLPPELLKSAKFYSNPKTAERLAQDSWFTDKEHPVFDREAEKIERNEITKILTQSGLHRRRRHV